MRPRIPISVLYLLSIFFVVACGVQQPEPVEEITLSPDLESVSEGTVIVTGRVVDRETGEAIANAVVSTSPETQILRTTARGEFVLQQDLTGGQLYRIYAEAEGYTQGHAAIIANTDRTSVDISLLQSNRALPIVFAPETVVLTPRENQTQISMVSLADEALSWSLRDAPDWIYMSPQDDVLQPNLANLLTISLNAEEFAAIASNDSIHYGSIEIRDDRDRIAILNVVAVSASDGSVSLEVEIEPENLAIGGSAIANAFVAVGEEGIAGATIAISIDGPDEGLDAPTSANADTAGRVEVEFEALIAGEYDVEFRVPAYPSVATISRQLIVLGEDLDCDINDSCETDAVEITDLSGPPPFSNDSFSTLEFSCSQPDCTFSCELQTSSTTVVSDDNCESPFSYPTVDDEYIFTVIATDSEGQTSEPASWTWIVDTEIPLVEILTGPDDYTTSTQAQFTHECSKDNCSFSCAMSEATEGTLFGPSSCGDTFAYPTTEDGEYTFTLTAIDQALNESEPDTWTWNLDREAPEVVDLQGPEGPTTESEAHFTFACSEPDCTLLCSLSGDAQGPMASDEDCSTGTLSYPSLANDSYTLLIKASDAAGNQTETTREWTVDSPTLVQNLSGPPELSNDDSPVLTFECSKLNCDFQCQLEGPMTTGPAACNDGSISYPELPDGDYLFTVWATDPFGLESDPATVSWTIDTTLPQIAFTETPDTVITDDWATFDFECTNKDSCVFRCRLDEVFTPGAWYDCAGPLTVSDLERGEYQFFVEATDAAGNQAEISHPFDVVPLGWSMISAGHQHGCALGTDRSLWCWGNGANYRLGLGGAVSQMVPRRVGGEDWQAVDSGAQHSCGIRVDGTLWCWGNGANGRLGLGDSSDAFFPTQVGGDDDWLQVVAGNAHTCGIREQNNTLYCWGSGSAGKLGLGDTENHETPQDVSAGWQTLSLSQFHTCGLQLDGSLYCWGSGLNGRLGLGDTNYQDLPTEVLLENVPFGLDEALPWISVSAGIDHSCAIREDHSLWCWGVGTDGQLGTGNTNQRISPTLVGVDLEWESVQTGSNHSCAQRVDGTLWCWGFNRKGQLGDEFSNQLVPNQMGARNDWESFSLGDSFSCAIDTDTNLHCWGSNQDGRLGLDLAVGFQTSPLPMTTAEEVSLITAGIHSACMITTTGELYCWGYGRLGRLGLGDYNNRALPTRVGTADDWAYVHTALGPDTYPSTFTGHTCAIRDDGRLFCWGYNWNGQLGLGDGTIRTVPTPVDPGTSWNHVDTGWTHTCGVQDNQSLWCWGGNLYGQLGQGHNSGRNTPQQVGSETWIDATAGRFHSCGIQSDRTLWCWGNGSLGLEEGGPHTTPQKVNEDIDWSRVVAGHDHTCGLKIDQSLWCWGNGSYGKLGIGGGGSSVPAQVGAETDWVQISPGDEHTCGLRTQGRAYCWGLGTLGRLGHGTTENWDIPRQLFHTDWTMVAAGGVHSHGIRSSQSGGFSWGYNQRSGSGAFVAGQRGDNTAFRRIPSQLIGPDGS